MENSQVNNVDELKNIVEPTGEKDIIKIIEVADEKTGKEIPLKNFFETDEVKALLNAKNCKSLLLYFEDKNSGNPPAISMASGPIEYIGQLFVPLVRSCLEHDPARLFILPNILIDIILDTIENHFKEIKFPVSKDNWKQLYSKETQSIHNTLRNILAENGFAFFIERWIEVLVETANEQDPETRDKVLSEINNMLSYKLYQTHNQSTERGN